jgi:hypothetical protein
MENEDRASTSQERYSTRSSLCQITCSLHGIALCGERSGWNEAHKKLLMSLAPVANDFSEVTFDFARILFVKYLGPELGMTIVAKIKDLPNVDDLRLPFYTDVSPGLLRAYGERDSDSLPSG